MISCIWYSSNAQETTCSQQLRQAQQLYEVGHFKDIPSLLENCINGGFTKEEKVQALKLLVLTDIFMDNWYEADTSMVDFLHAKPDYEVNPDFDPSEFINLYNSFRTWPAWSFGFKIGSNISTINITELYGVDNTIADSSSSSINPGLQIGIIGEHMINESLHAFAEIQFSQNNFTKTSRLFDYNQQEVKENQTWFGIPFGLRYTFKGKKIRPFIYLGGDVSYLMSSIGNVTRLGSFETRPIVSPNFDYVNSGVRNRLNVSAIGGFGIKIKTGIHNVIIDVRGQKGFPNLSTVDNRFGDRELLYRFGYVDDDFQLNSFSLSVGYIYSIYKVKKIKNKKL
ncbi:porin family protein [Marinigracilibium pacificum]|uniref:PorT family protein n=1 Tax=Marinigracilibium pacificum TaxID=2729599 RepID=A0A848J1W4_9BACT|nr:outer membrane beta-barrel protein [Marinigracilibium pacificum]NMM49328.1 PorT family protein [Marinigracilibium pacificum]